jgi:S1-C subfamily serine protease
VDLQGQLIGIPTLRTIDPQFKVPANRVGFALPSNRAEFLAPQLIHAGKVKQSGRVEMGMQVTMLDPTIAAQYQLSIDRGVLVVNVVPNGPTAKAKLKPGDAIVQLGNKERRCPSHRWPAPGESQNPLRLENPLLRLV